MAGAIIPDDWDGVSFNCQKVIWPSSVKWRAILRGQITEPERTSFWDPDSGTVQDAVDAVEDAEFLTSPGFWTETCDVIPGHPVAAFKAYPTSLLLMLGGTWDQVRFNALKWDHNSSGFDVVAWGHDADSVEKYGIWHYDIQVAILPVTGNWKIRALQGVGGTELARKDDQDFTSTLSFDYDWLPDDPEIIIEVYGGGPGTVQAGFIRVWFSGHYLGEVSE